VDKAKCSSAGINRHSHVVERVDRARAILARRNSENVTLWDIAGAFIMMGCAAMIFNEPDQVVRFFEQLLEQHPHTRL
jgi:hypothetical protein